MRKDRTLQEWLDHQPPSGLRHESKSWMRKCGIVDGLDVDEEQMALDEVFSLLCWQSPSTT